VLVNPDNPSGRALSPDQVVDLTEGALLVDEAFVDVDPALSIAPVAGAPGRERLIVLRSFGKFHGLAGARLGFLVAEPDLAARVRQALGDWPVSGPAIAAGLAAYADPAWACQTRRRLIERHRAAGQPAAPRRVRDRRRNPAVSPGPRRRRAAPFRGPGPGRNPHPPLPLGRDADPLWPARARPGLAPPRRRPGELLMTDDLNAQDLNAKHAEAMKALKAERDAMMETKTLEKGLLLVHTGDGKGKSSAGFGMVARHLGWGLKVGVVQYIKGKWKTGERLFFKKFPDQVRYEVMGEGFTWDTQDRERDIAAAQAAWLVSQQMIADPKLDFVLLDEINIALRYDYLDIDEVVAVLKARPNDKHVCLTGRNAKPQLLEIADLVTEMTLVKHPFEQGFKAQRGVEF
jgi:cob(I)alamin adenosyltransferase